MIRIATALCSLIVMLGATLAHSHRRSLPARSSSSFTSPGGGTDLARTVADILTREKIVTQAVNVSNKPGGGGAIACTYIKSKRGDPHVVMAVASMAMLSAIAPRAESRARKLHAPRVSRAGPASGEWSRWQRPTRT